MWRRNVHRQRHRGPFRRGIPRPCDHAATSKREVHDIACAAAPAERVTSWKYPEIAAFWLPTLDVRFYAVQQLDPGPDVEKP